MIQLSREIRFSLFELTAGNEKPTNSWAGWPSTNWVVPHLTLRLELIGEVNLKTGYLCNIKVVDDLVRLILKEQVLPRFSMLQSAEALIFDISKQIFDRWDHPSQVTGIHLSLSPYLTYSVLREPKMPTETHVELTQQFEFSASHRLHCHELSEEENRSLFGKCNNPNGHGHNYVFEVTVSRGNFQGSSGQVISLAELESTVKRLVVDPLDHKHLNEDVDYFRDVNPSVENIAVAIFNWLEGAFGDAKLKRVKVFETPKTWAQYSGSS
ncbi:MAG: 6-carboxytetrahydropterin synthase [Planctomycetota bacterium]